MSTNLKNRFKEAFTETPLSMPKGHEARFLNKLNKDLPKTNYTFYLKLVASVVLFVSVSLSGVYYFSTSNNLNLETVQTVNELKPSKTLGDISPDFKKIENYYLANINLQLANMTITENNKALFDGYLEDLEILNTEYEKLSDELTQKGVNTNIVNALITNLKLRLNLMQRLNVQLEEFETVNQTKEFI